MSTYDDVLASIDHHRLSAMVHKTNALRTALRRRETRCRICRDEAVRIRVDNLLDWHGIPILMGANKYHVVTYADILRDLGPLNRGRAQDDQITYHSLWVHAKRHYDLEALVDSLADRVDREFTKILGIPAWRSAEAAATPGTNQVRRNGESACTLLATMLDKSSARLDDD